VPHRRHSHRAGILLTLATAALVGTTVHAAPSAAQPPAKVRHPLPTVVYNIDTSDRVFFITIDDGTKKQRALADYVTRNKIPVTSFVTADAIDNRWSYFANVSAFDSVQNHSMTHKPLGRDSTDREYEICRTQRLYANRFGVRPWLLRPPYGDGWFSRRYAAPEIKRVAATCGVRYIVLWNIVVLKDGRVLFVKELKFKPGDIVLLHFEGDIKANVQRIIELYARHGIKPAPLSQYLPNTPPASP